MSVAATAPAFAASPNVAVLQTACATFTDSSGGCGLFIRQAKLTWQITTMMTIPVGITLQVSWSRDLYCRHNRVTGSLRTGGYIGERSTAETARSANYPVIKAIPLGTHTFEEGFAVDSSTPTLITLTVPAIAGEANTADNSASRNVRTVMGSTSCA